jgi:diguanylate cyclase (GGDEF)-like protein/PAS domain S-box-containing protein
MDETNTDARARSRGARGSIAGGRSAKSNGRPNRATGVGRLFLGLPVPQAVLTLDGHFAEVNAALSDALGMDLASLVGWASSEFLHPDDRSRAREEFVGLLTGRAPSLASVRRYLLPDGEIRYGLTTMALLPDDDLVNPGLVVVLVQDVTTEHRAHARVNDALAQLGQVERQFQAMVTRSADVAIIVNPHATITYCSPAVTEVFGYDPVDLVGRSGFDLIHPDDVEVAAASLAGALNEPGPIPTVTLRVRSADGSYAWTEGVATNSLDDPDIGGFIINVRDISQRVATERKYREVVEMALEGIWIVDATGRTTFANQRLASMLGRQIDEIVGRTPMELATADSAPVFAAQLEARRRGEPGRYEAELRHADGSVVNVLVSAQPHRDDSGTITGAHAMMTDITGLKAVERQLSHHALHDDLTGLANRVLLTDRVEHMLSSLSRRERLGAVLMIDVDGFKLVNDSYGHETGDDLLTQVADRISSALRANDTAARVGDDEFAAVCEELHDRKEASDIARRILAAIAEPVMFGNDTVVITASVGIAFTPAESGTTLLRDATIALHRAKCRGGAQITIFDPTELQTARRDLILAHDLQRALDDNCQLEVHYQPIVALGDQRVCGAEALARWRHPRYGMLQPDAFIPVAERAGLIGPLDCKILTSACAQTAQWLSEGSVADDFVIAINVSAAHLCDPDLLHCIDRSLSHGNLRPHHLAIEVTETALITDGEHVTRTLSALRDRGVLVALDDFGTGYSSLSYLKSVPADRLKIDRSFVGGLGDEGDDAIVTSIISLADAVGMRCIAEGIESVEQLSALTQLGCAYGQGFLWSAGVSAEEFPRVARGFVAALPFRPTAARRRAQWVASVDPRTRGHITSLVKDGASLQTIAAALNRTGLRTPRDTRWHAASVAQVIAAVPAVRHRSAARTGT